MLDTELLASIAKERMSSSEVNVKGKLRLVGYTSRDQLRTLVFNTRGREYQAIEPNPEKPSRWGQLQGIRSSSSRREERTGLWRCQ
jgi:hypothetical protein